MTLKKSLLILIPLLAVARILFFAPSQPVRQADAHFCGCGSCTTMDCCCGAGNWTSCTGCDKCGKDQCCSTSTASWGGCSATSLLDYCSSCGGDDCCSQGCSPAGGYRSCCTTVSAATITTTYPPATVVSPYGGVGGTVTVNSPGVGTVASGQTFDFTTLIVNTGTVRIPAGSTGVIKYSTACN